MQILHAIKVRSAIASLPQTVTHSPASDASNVCFWLTHEVQAAVHWCSTNAYVKELQHPQMLNLDFVAMQVPLYLRQWVTSISAIPASGGSAYTEAGHITFFDAIDLDVMVHESTHAQDQGFSGSATYLNAIGSNSCVPDDYAQTNNVECYAQDMVVFLYKLWNPYNPPLGTECMSGQLNAINSSQAFGLQAYINATGTLYHPALTSTEQNTQPGCCTHTRTVHTKQNTHASAAVGLSPCKWRLHLQKLCWYNCLLQMLAVHASTTTPGLISCICQALHCIDR